eukprot:PhM_4_TR8825/c0_g1_i1/m.43699
MVSTTFFSIIIVIVLLIIMPHFGPNVLIAAATNTSTLTLSTTWSRSVTPTYSYTTTLTVATPTSSHSSTRSSSTTVTLSSSSSRTVSTSPADTTTASPSISVSPSKTASTTPTQTPTPVESQSVTITATMTDVSSNSHSATLMPTSSAATPSPSRTASLSLTVTASLSLSSTPTATRTPSRTEEVSPTRSATMSHTISVTKFSPSRTPTPSSDRSASFTGATPSPSNEVTSSVTLSPSISAEIGTPTYTRSISDDPSMSPTINTPSMSDEHPSFTYTSTLSKDPTATPSASYTPSGGTFSPSDDPTRTYTGDTNTPSMMETSSVSHTETISMDPTVTRTATFSRLETQSGTFTGNTETMEHSVSTSVSLTSELTVSIISATSSVTRVSTATQRVSRSPSTDDSETYSHSKPTMSRTATPSGDDPSYTFSATHSKFPTVSPSLTNTHITPTVADNTPTTSFDSWTRHPTLTRHSHTHVATGDSLTVTRDVDNTPTPTWTFSTSTTKELEDVTLSPSVSVTPLFSNITAVVADPFSGEQLADEMHLPREDITLALDAEMWIEDTDALRDVLMNAIYSVEHRTVILHNNTVSTLARVRVPGGFEENRENIWSTSRVSRDRDGTVVRLRLGFSSSYEPERPEQLYISDDIRYGLYHRKYLVPTWLSPSTRVINITRPATWKRRTSSYLVGAGATTMSLAPFAAANAGPMLQVLNVLSSAACSGAELRKTSKAAAWTLAPLHAAAGDFPNLSADASAALWNSITLVIVVVVHVGVVHVTMHLTALRVGDASAFVLFPAIPLFVFMFLLPSTASQCVSAMSVTDWPSSVAVGTVVLVFNLFVAAWCTLWVNRSYDMVKMCSFDFYDVDTYVPNALLQTVFSPNGVWRPDKTRARYGILFSEMVPTRTFYVPTVMWGLMVVGALAGLRLEGVGCQATLAIISVIFLGLAVPPLFMSTHRTRILGVLDGVVFVLLSVLGIMILVEASSSTAIVAAVATAMLMLRVALAIVVAAVEWWWLYLPEDDAVRLQKQRQVDEDDADGAAAGTEMMSPPSWEQPLVAAEHNNNYTVPTLKKIHDDTSMTKEPPDWRGRPAVVRIPPPRYDDNDEGREVGAGTFFDECVWTRLSQWWWRWR